MENSTSDNVPSFPLCRTTSFTYAGGDLIAKENTFNEPYNSIAAHLSQNYNKTSTPAGNKTKKCDSSNGFQNTIAVLERHVMQRKLWNTDPASTANTEKDPTSLELQLLVIERLKSVRENSRLAWFLMNYIIFTDINNGTKRAQKQENIAKLARNLKGDTNDHLYHIAREKSGLLYLKVVKSPQHQQEKGKFWRETHCLVKNLWLWFNTEITFTLRKHFQRIVKHLS